MYTLVAAVESSMYHLIINSAALEVARNDIFVISWGYHVGGLYWRLSHTKRWMFGPAELSLYAQV